MIRFGRSTVDLPSRSIELDGDPIHVEPQAFDLLAYLLAHRDRVVPKTELLDEVWGDQFVSESALTTRVKEVRRALGDDGTRQKIIKNFRGRGYRFVAVVDDEADSGGEPGDRRSVATSLYGRDGDIAAVERLLDDSTLVTLVGPGGIGKTSLARDVAMRRRDLHADGVLVVRLAAVRDPGAIRHQIRRDAGLDEAGVGETDLVSAIANLDALLVLDNCEHLIAETARLVDAIVLADGRVRILATSRVRLGVGAERVWPLEPLSGETARQLLVERARSARPGFELPTGSDSAVVELLDRLDRLPLAIEMAAARLPTVGLDDLLILLRDRLDLLRTADQSADDRHRTISGLIEWSEELLDEPQRDVLTCLSTFAGPAIASDLAAVAQIDAVELTAGSLAACVDHSLVVVDTVRQPTTYRVLETVGASAARRRTAVHEARHARRIIDVATEMDRTLRTADEREAAQRLDGLHADLRVAHRWARQHDPAAAGELTAALLHYAHERQWAEPVTWAEQLVDAAPADDPARLAANAACAADRANTGDYVGAVALAEPALDSDDHRVLASVLDTLINVGIYTGDLAMTRRHTATLRDLGRQTGDGTVQANVVTSEMMILTYGGHPDQALEHLEHNPLSTTASPTATAWVTYIEADALAALGRESEAIERFDEAIRLGSLVGSRFVVSVARVSSLTVRSRVGDLDAARAAFVPVLLDYRRIRSDTHAITALRNLVALLVRAGDDENAMVLLGALSNADTKATYGSESQRIDDARAVVESRVAPDVLEQWISRGVGHDPIWALDHAIAVLS